MQENLALSASAAGSDSEWLGQLHALCSHNPMMSYSGERLRGDIAVTSLGGIPLAHVRHNAIAMTRPAPSSHEDRSRYVILAMELAGSSEFCQAGVVARIDPGEAVLLDSSLAFSASFDGNCQQVLAYLPAEELLFDTNTAKLPRLRTHGRAEPIGSMVAPVLMSILRGGGDMTNGETLSARRILIEIARGLVGRQRPVIEDARPVVSDARVRNFIDLHLSDPELTPRRIAAECRISLRRLHRIFAGTSWSVCSWLRHSRLERCRQDLLDPALRHLNLTQIAFRWGFNDAAHFSRSYREAYDETPTDTRRGLLERPTH